MFAKLAALVAAFALLLAGLAPASAQGVPDAISYQGKLTNPSGEPVTNGSHQVVFSFYNAASEGNLLWTSPQIGVTTTAGVFTTQIQSIPSSVFAGSDVWLEIQVDGQTLAPRAKFASVPYAIRAGTGGSSSGWSLTGNAGTNPGVNFLGTTDQLPLILKSAGAYARDRLPRHG